MTPRYLLTEVDGLWQFCLLNESRKGIPGRALPQRQLTKDSNGEALSITVRIFHIFSGFEIEASQID